MNILKYFRKRKKNLSEDVLNSDLPRTYIEFLSNFNPISIVMLLLSPPSVIGVEKGNKIIRGLSHRKQYSGRRHLSKFENWKDI